MSTASFGCGRQSHTALGWAVNVLAVAMSAAICMLTAMHRSLLQFVGHQDEGGEGQTRCTEGSACSCSGAGPSYNTVTHFPEFALPCPPRIRSQTRDDIHLRCTGHKTLTQTTSNLRRHPLGKNRTVLHRPPHRTPPLLRDSVPFDTA